MTDKSLVDALERATEGSRALSDRVLLVVTKWSIRFHGHGKIYERPDGYHVDVSDVPDPIRSVDDAIALVPEGWRIIRVGERQFEQDWVCEMERRDMLNKAHVFCKAATPALAICAAVLRAQEADHG